MTGSGKREAGSVSSPPTVSLLVHVQPRARQTEIVGWHGDAIKIRVAAPPADGAANDELVRYLAQRLELPRNQVRLVSGTTGRRKRVEITGVDPGWLAVRLGIVP